MTHYKEHPSTNIAEHGKYAADADRELKSIRRWLRVASILPEVGSDANVDFAERIDPE